MSSLDWYFKADTRKLKLRSSPAFTIVELLVVIVVIGILAAVAIATYNGIRNRAVGAQLQSELGAATRALKLDRVALSSYPEDLNQANNGQGLVFGDNITPSYVVDNSANPPTFCLSLTKDGISYFATQSSSPADGSCDGDDDLPVPEPAYGDVVLEDSPVAYWRFQESSGTTVSDASGNGHNLTLTSESGLGAGGLSGDAGDLSWDAPGSDASYGYVPSASWQDVNTFTVEAIIQPDTTSSYRGIVTHDSRSNRSWNFYLQNSQLLVYDYSVGGNGDVLRSSQSLAAGQRHHVAMTYRDKTVKLYVNGTPVGTRSNVTLRTTSTSMPMVIGGSYAGTSKPTFLFDGKIDEVAFYHTALSAERLAAHASKAGL